MAARTPSYRSVQYDFVPADYKDNKDDIAVFRPSTGQ